jgi:hypothetical protein
MERKMQTTLTRSQPLTNKAPQSPGAEPLPSTSDKASSPIENKAAPRNRLIPTYRKTLDPEAPIGTQALARMREVAITWWSMFEAMHEGDAFANERRGALPEWARQLIGTYQQQHAAYEELRKWADIAEQAMRLSEGKQVGVFEVWTERGHRLDGQHAFWSDADAARERLSARFPDAYVCRLHPRRPAIFPDSADLLDTMIGRVFWCGVGYGDNDEPDFHTVQDSTGRTATVPADMLISHAVFQQMTAEGQQQVALHEDHAQRRCARRAAAKDE